MAQLDDAVELADRSDRLRLLVVHARNLRAQFRGVALEGERDGRAALLLVDDEAVGRLDVDDAGRRCLDADLHVLELALLLGREARKRREEVALEEHVDRLYGLRHRWGLGAGCMGEDGRNGEVRLVGGMGRDEGERVVRRVAAEPGEGKGEREV